MIQHKQTARSKMLQFTGVYCNWPGNTCATMARPRRKRACYHLSTTQAKSDVNVQTVRGKRLATLGKATAAV